MGYITLLQASHVEKCYSATWWIWNDRIIYMASNETISNRKMGFKSPLPRALALFRHQGREHWRGRGSSPPPKKSLVKPSWGADYTQHVTTCPSPFLIFRCAAGSEHKLAEKMKRKLQPSVIYELKNTNSQTQFFYISTNENLEKIGLLFDNL